MADLLRAWSKLWARLSGQRAGEPELPGFTREYDRIYAALDRSLLREEPAEAASLEADLFRVDARPRRLLNTYSQAGAAAALERYGFLDLLRARGFDPVVSVDASEPDSHRLYLHDGEAGKARRLVELVMNQRELELPDGAVCSFLFVNWLLMQDPRASFPEGQRPLPDQTHPGLGLFVRFAYLLKLVADRIGADGLMNHPAHPHNGVLYGKFCHFVDPVLEGQLRALERDLPTRDLAWLSEEIEAGRVVDEGGRPLVWEAEAQVVPTSRRARAWFRSARWREAVVEAREARRFRHLGEPPPGPPPEAQR